MPDPIPGCSWARPRIALEVDRPYADWFAGRFLRELAAHVDFATLSDVASDGSSGAREASLELDGLVCADAASNTVDHGGGLGGEKRRRRDDPHGCWQIAVETDSRLQQDPARHHFLARIFAFADLRRLGPGPPISAVGDFQRRHKHLLMTYDPQAMRALGRIASDARLRGDERYRAYARRFREALRVMPSRGAYVNALMHMYGHFKHRLSASEIQSFLMMLESFNAGSQTLAAVADVIRGWCERFDYDYLADQSMLELYPRALVRSEGIGEGVCF